MVFVLSNGVEITKFYPIFLDGGLLEECKTLEEYETLKVPSSQRVTQSPSLTVTNPSGVLRLNMLNPMQKYGARTASPAKALISV